MEAAALVGFLKANGIEAGYDTFSVGEPLGYAIPSTGRQEIFVRAEDLERARELLESR